MGQQALVFLVLAGALCLFIWGRWRYDLVALLALLVVSLAGVIPGDEAFLGFGHPAVVTVVAVLVVSRGLQNAGVVDLLARPLLAVGNRPTAQVGALTSLVASLSAFMNNVGALALLLPVTLRLARKSSNSPSLLLMPLAFASLLGGLVTLIGTPPNIIIAMSRAQTGAEPFRMFDFTPVGLGVALAGVLFIALGGWRLVPQRRAVSSREELFETGDYVTEVTVPETAPLVGRRVRDLGLLTEAEVVVLGLVREGEHQPAPSSFTEVMAGDRLVVEANPKDLQTLLQDLGLQLSASRKIGEAALEGQGSMQISEAVIANDSPLMGETPKSLNLRWRFGVNLLGVARMDVRLPGRLRDIEFKSGDILLLQGPKESLAQTMATLGCLPLAEREFRLGRSRRPALGLSLFLTALLASALGGVPIQLAFVAAAVAMILTGLLSLREAYESISWPVIILLGAMIPVGNALEASGGAKTIAQSVLAVGGQLPPAVTLLIVLVATMFLSDLVNNAAAAVLMAPIAISVAAGLNASADPFLMAVAIGASCAFLTPIGHQSNTLVMGPGGYRFGDYWKLGLLLEVVIVAVAMPLLLVFWPLH